MIISLIAASVVVLTALAVVTIIRTRRLLDVRAAQRARRRLIEREQRLAELRMQRVMHDTVSRLFEAAREQR